ncbi:DUF2157 domain-containing protein [Desulfobulbus rhabdoformis]|uniref:DUF2157 domain-containing protein n=1 Tax=Desulfobulbus rhabdoformis TaxID=34032 RepID=UPI00196684C1|nr:DUF2157 domain-containing protein [Desulfobulbus rhabdoformis]MBM9616677.1 DUF2157 domain-containing protein [Desulfobulbus rhabdoformis]
MQIGNKTEAQQRADQIDAFRSELESLRKEQVLMLEPLQEQAVRRYHRRLLGKLSAGFDIDTTNRQKQLSLGMGITSSIGAMGLAASVFFFYYQYWGFLALKTQVTMLVSMPFAVLLLTVIMAWMEKSGYFAKLFALIAFVCFVLNLSMLGQIFNIAPSPLAMLIWSVFGFLLAYAVQSRFMLSMGIVSFAGFLSAQTATWCGSYWISFGERPENFFPAALGLFLISLIPHRWYPKFSALYRVFALLLFFLPVLILANYGQASYVDYGVDLIEMFYQVVGFVLAGVMIVLGILFGWPEVVNTANTFFTLFLYTKFYDWWWEWLPKYQFFLLVGLTAILMLVVLKRLRLVSVRRKAEAAL